MTVFLLDVNVLIALVDPAHGGRLATMDQRLATEVVPGGHASLEVI